MLGKFSPAFVYLLAQQGPVHNKIKQNILFTNCIQKRYQVYVKFPVLLTSDKKNKILFFRNYKPFAEVCAVEKQ